jgi:putative ABC transport system permease protein
MPASYLQLSSTQVGAAALLILINAAISLALRLGLERSLLWASVRTIVQLVLIGCILEWVFRLQHWTAVVVIMAVMTLVAGVTAFQRTPRRYPGMLISSIVSIWSSAWLILALALWIILERSHAWYDPQYVIPLLGMILGNTLTGVTLGLTGLTDSLAQQRDRVEALLALGATRWEASRETVRQAVRTGMVPMINSMMVVGLVSLPGMMTGQMLSGVAPLEAVKYQIVIMFLIASATALGVFSVVLMSYRRLFNADHQFCWDLTQG